MNAYNLGRVAYASNETNNPYEADSKSWKEWRRGWLDAYQEDFGLN